MIWKLYASDHWKRQLIGAAMVFFIGVASGFASGHAQSEPITATYRWVATTEQPDGTFAATFAFTFTNNGAIDFNDLRVGIIDSQPFNMTYPSAQLEVGALPAGATTTGSWEISFPYPIENTSALIFLGDGQDATVVGEHLLVTILGEEAAQ